MGLLTRRPPAPHWVPTATAAPAAEDTWIEAARGWVAAREGPLAGLGEPGGAGAPTGGEDGDELWARALHEQSVPNTPANRERLRDALVGFGPLAPHARAPGVTDVLLDAAGTVWTDGPDGLEDTGTRVDPAAARALAVRLITQGGRRLDAAVPAADVRLHGVRVHAVLPPLSAGAAVVSLRVPSGGGRSLEQLAAGWQDGAAWLRVLRRLVRRRASVLVAGATGSGKTTLMAAALGEVDAAERIVTVEDTLELAPAHPHVVALQARTPNAEGAGEVTLAELIRHALRMRPDRVVLGECRGPEVADMLTALNTGHPGGWGSLHANSARDVPARLVAMGSLAGWEPRAVTVQAAAGVDAVLHLERRGGVRQPVELAVPVLPEPAAAGLAVLPALTQERGAARRGPGWDALWERTQGRGGHG